MEYLNTLPGYKIENATAIPDAEDNEVGLYAGMQVRVCEEHEDFAGMEGEIQAIMQGEGMMSGSIVVDVLLDDSGNVERLYPDDLEPV